MKYILIAFSFFSCNIIPNHNDPARLKISTEVLDIVKTRPAKFDARPVLFEAAFIKGTTLEFRDLVYNVYGVTIGKLKITSGRIIACDPMHIDEYGIPFTQVFPTGEFPVQLAIAEFEQDEIIAFARINFSDEPVEKWEFALQDGQAAIPLRGKKMHGYSTDGGVGLFMDEEASKVLDKNTVADMDGEVFKEMDKHYRHNWRYTLYNFGKHNLASFSSGFGDGYYASFIGFDAKGKPCRLLTDFGLFKWK